MCVAYQPKVTDIKYIQSVPCFLLDTLFLWPSHSREIHRRNPANVLVTIVLLQEPSSSLVLFSFDL